MSHSTATPNESSMFVEMEFALERLAIALVGQNPMRDAQDLVKRAMLGEALRRTQGNFTRTASLLGVKRQAIQQLVCRYELQEWVRARGRCPREGQT